MEQQKRLIINTAWCKGCGICAAFCPKEALEIRNEKVRLKEDAQCVLCGACELRCPDYAIYIEKGTREDG
ncbi:MAG: 4Fe-4S binding protein [Clostridia bacterium]|nr:4Fe-4S binding protein [Clostridia bacterium]